MIRDNVKNRMQFDFFSNICVRNGCFICVEKFRKGRSDNGTAIKGFDYYYYQNISQCCHCCVMNYWVGTFQVHQMACEGLTCKNDSREFHTRMCSQVVTICCELLSFLNAISSLVLTLVSIFLFLIQQHPCNI